MTPRLAVFGATFGAHYARAAQHPDSPVELVCIGGAGGPTSQAVAQERGVPTVSLDDVVGGTLQVDAAVVAVRSAVVGGEGDAIAQDLLNHDIAVIQELPSHSRDIARTVALARRRNVAFLATAFYPFLSPVRRFAARCSVLRQVGSLTQVHVRVCRQTLHAALFVLADLLTGPPPRSVEVMPGQFTHLVRLVWEDVEVCLTVGAGLDPNDPDNMAQPLMAFTLVHVDGELSLDHPHGPTRWAPRQHQVGGRLSRPSQRAQVVLPPDDEPTGQRALEELWPRGVHCALERLLAGACLTGQRELAVLRLWEVISSQLPPTSTLVSAEPVDRFELLAMER